MSTKQKPWSIKTIAPPAKVTKATKPAKKKRRVNIGRKNTPAQYHRVWKINTKGMISLDC